MLRSGTGAPSPGDRSREVARAEAVITSGVEVARQRRGPEPTGEVLNRGGAFAVCLGRSFAVDHEVVWSWLTEPDKLRVWLGRRAATDSSGPGRPLFRLAGDSVDAPLFDYVVEEMEAPRQLTVSLRESGPHARAERAWRLQLVLSAVGDGSHLMLEQTITDRVPAPSVAAACEYYLDRLVRAAHGRAFSDLDFDDYFLAQGPAYRRMFPLPLQPTAEDRGSLG